MGGDQDEECVGFIRRVKASSLVNVTEMSGAAGCAVSGRRTKQRTCYFPRTVSEWPLEVEREGARDGGLCGEEDGATEVEGRADCLY